MTLLPSSVTLSISLIEYFPPTKVQSNPGLGQPCTKHCEAVYSQNVCRLHLQALATSNSRCCLYSFKIPFLNQALYVSRPAISFGESWHRLESERLFSARHRHQSYKRYCSSQPFHGARDQDEQAWQSRRSDRMQWCSLRSSLGFLWDRDALHRLYTVTGIVEVHMLSTATTMPPAAAPSAAKTRSQILLPNKCRGEGKTHASYVTIHI